ncbi:HTH-type transcriptional repressor YvoA [Rhodococcus sp. PBTS 1]|nr:HTH-type transcriptional repressor YvoA [Rhodococcus sp. PBTS 1]
MDPVVIVIDDGRPIFLQIAEMIENSIIDGSLAEEAQVPSTNELAAFHRINPATAGKGLGHLVADGILYKKRGIGMFVTTGARDALRIRRRERFADQYVTPLVAEARKLGLGPDEIMTMIADRAAAPAPASGEGAR